MRKFYSPGMFPNGWRHVGGGGGGPDADATAFLTATGITDPTISTAINDLVVAAKAHGWWSQCKAIYPMVGGTATTCKYNLKDPQDLDASFRLTFVNSPTIDAGGVDWDGATQYADTHLTPSSVLTIDNTHLSYWSTENNQSGFDIGYQKVTGDNGNMFLISRYPGADLIVADMYQGSGNGRFLFANTNSVGLFLVDRVSSSDYRIYQNGSQISSTLTGTNGALPIGSLYIGAANTDAGLSGVLSSRKCQWASIGDGITSQSDFYTDIAAFQTAIGR